jgi:23S rRNA-/tRNA-specific pseudouridylate synthase
MTLKIHQFFLLLCLLTRLCECYLFRVKGFFFSRVSDNCMSRMKLCLRKDFQWLEQSTKYNSGVGKEKIIYLDSDLIVVDKPANALTVPDVDGSDSIASRIASLLKLSRVDKMVVHRLDYATSGLVVFARNDDALKSLNAQFRNGLVEKSYLAIVEGNVVNNNGTVDIPIGRDEIRGSPLYTTDPSGKPAISYWKKKLEGNGRTILELVPVTGRLSFIVFLQE